MHPTIEGCAASMLQDIDTATQSRVADELASIDAATDTNAQLRAALSDTSVPGRIRAAVLWDVLQGKVGDVTLNLATYAVRQSPAQDTNYSLHDLAVFAQKFRRDGVAPAEPLGLTQARQRVAGFVDARLVSLTPADMEQIEDDLFRWARTIESNLDLRRLLMDRDVEVAARQSVTSSLLSGKVHASALAIALYVVEGGRSRDIVGTLDAMVQHVALARQWRVAIVHAARPLSDAEQSELARSLTAMAGGNVDLQVKIDEELLAGVVVYIGDLCLDATARGRLQNLRDSLLHSRPVVFS